MNYINITINQYVLGNYIWIIMIQFLIYFLVIVNSWVHMYTIVYTFVYSSTYFTTLFHDTCSTDKIDKYWWRDFTGFSYVLIGIVRYEMLS